MLWNFVGISEEIDGMLLVNGWIDPTVELFNLLTKAVQKSFQNSCWASMYKSVLYGFQSYALFPVVVGWYTDVTGGRTLLDRDPAFSDPRCDRIHWIQYSRSGLFLNSRCLQFDPFSCRRRPIDIIREQGQREHFDMRPYWNSNISAILRIHDLVNLC